MKIGIDISAVIYGTGVSVYTKNLVRALLTVDKENEYVLFGGSLRRRGELKDFLDTLNDSTFKGRVFPMPPTLADIVWNRLCVFSTERLVGDLDVFHSSDWAQPPSKAFKVTTIHDPVPIKYPKLSHPRIVSVHKARLARVKKVVDRVIVPSKKTADDVSELGIEKKKVRVIPEAPDPIFKPAGKKEVEKLKKKYGVTGGYLLAVGVNPRKNIKRIIKAFLKIRKDRDLKLLVVGETFIGVKEKKGVRFLGHVDQAEMPLLFSGAEALVYPSLYEGFGLPILEAFSCKTPVVTSNIGSMSEVAGGAAVLVDPKSTKSLVGGIKKALKDSEKLVKKGVKRSKKYSWEETARKTLAVYEESAE